VSVQQAWIACCYAQQGLQTLLPPQLPPLLLLQLYCILQVLLLLMVRLL
jgi:hypothetical protein